MNAKEIGKECFGAGLLALFLNPVFLIIIVVLGVAILVVGMVIVVYYGLVTAITLCLLTSICLVVLHYIKAIDLNRQPLIAILPGIMFLTGYIAERLQIFSIQPLWSISKPSIVPSGNMPILIVLVAALLVLVVGISRRKK